MGGTEGDHTGKAGPMTAIWSNRAPAIQPGASAYRKAVDPSSFARKRCVSSTMAAALLQRHLSLLRLVSRITSDTGNCTPPFLHKAPCGRTQRGDRLGPSPWPP